MQKQYIYYLVLFLLIVYLFSLPSYISYLPTIPVYPDNVEDADKTLLATRSCTDEEKAFFYLTNKSVASAFKPYVNESIQELEDIFIPYNIVVYFFKYGINRARPSQINPMIKPLNASTAQTPAYPAGHAMQAQMLAIVLGKRYPNKKQLFLDIALKCDIVRVKTGLHYYSDGIFGRHIVNSLFSMY